LLQVAFAQLGESIKAQISQSAAVEQAQQVVQQADISGEVAKALTDALTPILQRLDLLTSQMHPTSTAQKVPIPRSLDPALVAQKSAVAKSSIRRLVELTT